MRRTLLIAAGCALLMATSVCRAQLARWNVENPLYVSGYPQTREVVIDRNEQHIYVVVAQYFVVYQNVGGLDAPLELRSVSLGANRIGKAIAILDNESDHFLYVLCQQGAGEQGRPILQSYSIANPSIPVFLAEVEVFTSDTRPTKLCCVKYAGTKYVLSAHRFYSLHYLDLFTVNDSGQYSLVWQRLVGPATDDTRFLTPVSREDDLFFFAGIGDYIYRTTLSTNESTPLQVRHDDVNQPCATPQSMQVYEDGAVEVAVIAWSFYMEQLQLTMTQNSPPLFDELTRRCYCPNPELIMCAQRLGDYTYLGLCNKTMRVLYWDEVSSQFRKRAAWRQSLTGDGVLQILPIPWQDDFRLFSVGSVSSGTRSFRTYVHVPPDLNITYPTEGDTLYIGGAVVSWLDVHSAAQTFVRVKVNMNCPSGSWVDVGFAVSQSAESWVWHDLDTESPSVCLRLWTQSPTQAEGNDWSLGESGPFRTLLPDYRINAPEPWTTFWSYTTTQIEWGATQLDGAPVPLTDGVDVLFRPHQVSRWRPVYNGSINDLVPIQQRLTRMSRCWAVGLTFC